MATEEGIQDESGTGHCDGDDHLSRQVADVSWVAGDEDGGVLGAHILSSTGPGQLLAWACPGTLGRAAAVQGAAKTPSGCSCVA